jgi:uncharacterized protein (DUF427 family)
MPKAVWNGKIIAESNKIKEIEGDKYFPPNSVNKKYLRKSEKHFASLDKGVANYFNVVVDDEVSWDSAWYYPSPRDEAKSIKDYVSFRNGIVDIEE